MARGGRGFPIAAYVHIAFPTDSSATLLGDSTELQDFTMTCVGTVSLGYIGPTVQVVEQALVTSYYW